MALYKTTTDQNVDTTQGGSIHYWDLPWGPLDLSVRKKPAFNIFNTLNRYMLYTLHGEIHVNNVSKAAQTTKKIELWTVL